MSNKIKNFFDSIRSEAKKVTWPSKKEIFKSTIVVIVAIIIFAIVIGGIDIFFLQLLRFFMR